MVDLPDVCGVCGAPHSTCTPAGHTDSEGVGVTRGVIVRQRPSDQDGRVTVPLRLTGAAGPVAPADPAPTSAPAPAAARPRRAGRTRG